MNLNEILQAVNEDMHSSILDEFDEEDEKLVYGIDEDIEIEDLEDHNKD